MIDYLESIKKRDPAAKSLVSVILTYPGVKAILFHKISNFFFILPDSIYLQELSLNWEDFLLALKFIQTQKSAKIFLLIMAWV